MAKRYTHYGPQLTAREGVCRDLANNRSWRRHVWRQGKCYRCGWRVPKLAGARKR